LRVIDGRQSLANWVDGVDALTVRRAAAGVFLPGNTSR
jgi:hypothetical protein